LAESVRSSVSDARRELGAELRRVREGAGLSTRQVDGISRGHVSRVENGLVASSRRFVAAYVAMGGNPGRLFSLWDRTRLLGRDGEAPTLDYDSDDDLPNALSDPHADPYLLRRGYTVECIEDTYLIGPNREAVRNEHSVAVRTTITGARYFPFRHGYDEDPRPGVSVVTPGPGCTMPIVTEGSTGSIYAVIGFDPDSTDASGACQLSWTIAIRSSVPTFPQVVGGTMSKIPQAITTVRFTPTAFPASLWWFRDFDSNAGMTEPSPDRVLTPGTDGSYSREFHDLDREWWGLAWTWPDEY
jgi:hypothetical protein